MAETMINGTAGGADFTVAAQSYKTTLHQFRVVVDIPQNDSTVFNDEPNETADPGPTRAFFDVAGYLKQGAASSGPFIPPPQNVALVFQFSGTANTIAFLGNFTRAEAIRMANANGLLTASGRSRSAITKVWNIGP